MNFHKFWTDARSETPRVIFITEYMTSGSLKQFLKKTRKSNYKTLNEKVNSKTYIVLIHSFVCSVSLKLKSLGLSLFYQTVSFTGLEKVVEANFVSSKVTARHELFIIAFNDCLPVRWKISQLICVLNATLTELSWSKEIVLPRKATPYRIPRFSTSTKTNPCPPPPPLHLTPPS